MRGGPGTAVLAYRLLLRAYPSDFRAKYGGEMLLIFRDQLRDGGGATLRFWLEAIWDVARSAPALRAAAARRWLESENQVGEDSMKVMGIFALVVGATQVVNALVESRAGWGQYGDAYPMTGVVLGVVAAALLMVAGVALLRDAMRAALWARVAAVGCIALVVLIRVEQPWMSIFGTLLGIGFPIALLIFLQITRGRGPSAPFSA